MGDLPFFILSCICLFTESVIGLEVEVNLEQETMEYTNTTMECKFDIGFGRLEYVQWEKNGWPFYRYSERKVPHKQLPTRPVAGVTVDLEQSNTTHVFLTNLKPQSSGEYACTVVKSGGGTLGLKNVKNMTTSPLELGPILVGTSKCLYVITTVNYSSASNWNTPCSYLRGPILSIGYHFAKRKVYYGASGGTVVNNDFKVGNDSKSLPELVGAILILEEEQVTSLAVDWLRDILYYTDDKLRYIGQINVTTEERKTLLESDQGVKNPESIAVDPFQGYLFWGDNNEEDKKIVASALDGITNKQTIVSKDLSTAILTLDLDRRRLFFIGSDGLSSCKYDGSARRVDLRHPALDDNVNSLSYYNEFIFWSRYNTRKSSSGLFFARLRNSEVIVKELPIMSILDVKVFHPDMQKRSIKYSCDLLECSDGCETNFKGSAYCTCPEGATMTAGATVCKKVTTERDCEKSVTIVNSKTACKGDLVLEENFDSSTLDHDQWQNTVRISSDHDFEFTVFDKDNENIYVKNGNLVIKPTLFDENTVLAGDISLIGCTTPRPHLCGKKAFSFNIIPPVRSALINTAHAFNFRYGVVTIRAKLPQGDWIYPVLNLHATKDFYNPDYKSGVMRIADVKGNQQFNCDGQEQGVKNLMSGVMVGPPSNVRKHFIQKLADKGWTEDFHIFQLTWTPDELSFSVDGQSSENIVPEGKRLRDILGLPSEDANSRFDPLVEDVYLSVGLGVGGTVEFPDNCISGSTGPKPWRNSEVKNMLKFWQKKSSWFSTWGDHSALLVDYITVRAL